MRVWKIVSSRFLSSNGIRVVEYNVLKENPKTLVLENASVTNLKKSKLNIIEEGVYRDTFEMYTLVFTDEKVEKLRMHAIDHWMKKKQEAINVLDSLTGEVEYALFRVEN